MAGFGIDSLLTPMLALETGTKRGGRAVDPALRWYRATLLATRDHVDHRVLLGFGLASAGGGLAGALLHVLVSSCVLAIVFGALLVLAAIAELNGLDGKVRWS